VSDGAASGGRAFRLVEALWVLFLLALPFYLLPSGSPQPADLPLMGLILLLAWGMARGQAIALPAAFSRSARALLLFVLYACGVGLVWTFLLGEPRLLVYPLFYVYNGLVFAAVLFTAARGGDRFLRLILHATAASLLLQLLLSPFLLVQDGFRYSLFFNNPNQLGYFALLGATVVLVGDRRLRLPWYYLAGTMVVAVLLAALSLSKSALLAMLLLLLLGLRLRPWVLGIILLAALFLIFGPELHPIISNVETRLLGITRDLDDSLAGRGYARIVNYPRHLIFGAGEGAFHRFETLLSGEIHSSFGTLLFSYGIVGLALFAALLLAILQGSSWSRMALLLPVFFYGLTHQGLRFRLLWVLLAYFLATRPPERKEG